MSLQPSVSFSPDASLPFQGAEDFPPLTDYLYSHTWSACVYSSSGASFPCQGQQDNFSLRNIFLFFCCIAVLYIVIAVAARRFLRWHCRPAGNGHSPLTLRTRVFSVGMKLAGADRVAVCVICLSELQSGEAICVLPRCNHGFHVACIKPWLSLSSWCPTCRTSCRTPLPLPDIV